MPLNALHKVRGRSLFVAVQSEVAPKVFTFLLYINTFEHQDNEELRKSRAVFKVEAAVRAKSPGLEVT